MTAGQVAERAGLRTSAVRYYETIGLLRAARIHGRREFGEDAVARLKLIGLAKAASFSLHDIRMILAGDRPAWQDHTAAKLAELDQTIARARSQREAVSRLMGCTCATIAECADRVDRGPLASFGSTAR